MPTFSQWLATMLKERELDVQRLLHDETALHFLIAWSVFEAKCFSGFLKANELKKFAATVSREGFDENVVAGPLAHFYARYQHKQRLQNLLHDDKTPAKVASAFVRCLKEPLSEMEPEDRLFLVLFVVYRFRNNMFHGNKRVESWLRFREQISLCTFVMQAFVSHSEAALPTMSIGDAA